MEDGSYSLEVVDTHVGGRDQAFSNAATEHSDGDLIDLDSPSYFSGICSGGDIVVTHIHCRYITAISQKECQDVGHVMLPGVIVVHAFEDRDSVEKGEYS
jgi:hypothetical protein